MEYSRRTYRKNKKVAHNGAAFLYVCLVKASSRQANHAYNGRRKVDDIIAGLGFGYCDGLTERAGAATDAKSSISIPGTAALGDFSVSGVLALYPKAVYEDVLHTVRTPHQRLQRHQLLTHVHHFAHSATRPLDFTIQLDTTPVATNDHFGNVQGRPRAGVARMHCNKSVFSRHRIHLTFQSQEICCLTCPAFYKWNVPPTSPKWPILPAVSCYWRAGSTALN
jgi:hypothetical protein